MNFIGVSCGFHDAAMSLIDSNGNILFAAHSERYSKIKHDSELVPELIDDLCNYITSENTEIHYYEKPLKKFSRQILNGQYPKFKNLNVKKIIGDNLIKKFPDTHVNTHLHHLSHAAAGFQTSPYDNATIVVIDAIGEWDTITIWSGCYNHKDEAHYKLLWRQIYPNSIGLFYSAMTKHIGLKPMDEEYILMGMSAYGKSKYSNELYNYAIYDLNNLVFKENFHIGADEKIITGGTSEDIAASTQDVAEKLIYAVIEKAYSFNYSKNLVYMGGVALNCVANRNLNKTFDNIWIMPNPGDAGSSLGAAALGYKKKLNWINAYLGHEIRGPYPVNDLLNTLINKKIAGVANGRAEFGPRALGNRSLLADPRSSDIKNLMNDIKRRQKFRPFAAVVLEEFADDCFIIPSGWYDKRYMQIVAKVREPNVYPAITHVDGTSRIQTVPKDGSGIRNLLELWYFKTGCPMLLNTSLNIKGEPMVNNRSDADRFEKFNNIKVFS